MFWSNFNFIELIECFLKLTKQSKKDREEKWRNNLLMLKEMINQNDYSS